MPSSWNAAAPTAAYTATTVGWCNSPACSSSTTFAVGSGRPSLGLSSADTASRASTLRSTSARWYAKCITAFERSCARSTLRRGNYSAGGRDPDVSAGQFGEDVEGAAAVFGRGGQVGAHRGEVLGASEGAQAPGHLLLDLGHPDVAFGLVVVERNAQVGGEP